MRPSESELTGKQGLSSLAIFRLKICINPQARFGKQNSHYGQYAALTLTVFAQP